MMTKSWSWVTWKHGVSIATTTVLYKATCVNGSRSHTPRRRGSARVMLKRARTILLLLLLSIFSAIIYMLWALHWRATILSRAEVENVPGPDKILGSLVTHISHPERREKVHVTESDPGILVSVKTTTSYHRHRLSLLLFTWMGSLSPHSVYN